MGMFGGLNINASALTANRLRMDVVSANIANANTTRGEFVNGQWVPYQRKVVELSSIEASPFESHLKQAIGDGVKVSQITGDRSPFKLVYNPDHPDANAEGYVQMPNVDIVKEMVDMMSASRAYEANVTAFNASKHLFMKALEIGK